MKLDKILKSIDNILKELPKEVKGRIALETYYNDYDIDDLFEIIKEVLVNEKDISKGSYVP